MLLPIYAYGQPVLKKKAVEINRNFEKLDELVQNMWDTMYNAEGVGLAAPQIGKSLRLFLIDTIQLQKEGEESKGFKIAFINAQVIEEVGKPWAYEEGCLSIPNIRGDVMRPETVTLKWMDEKLNEYQQTFDGIAARVIQHEYDHIEGILFTEKLKPLKKKLIKRKLEAIRKGNVKSHYRLKFV